MGQRAIQAEQHLNDLMKAAEVDRSEHEKRLEANGSVEAFGLTDGIIGEQQTGAGVRRSGAREGGAK